MLTRYSQIVDTSDIEIRERSLECVRTLTFPNVSQNGLSNEKKIDLIVKGLKIKDKTNLFRPVLIEAIGHHGETAMIKLIEAWHKDKKSSGILEGLRSFGDDLINHLIQDLAKQKGVEDLLARIGDPAVSSLTSKLKSKDLDDRFAAADALVLMTYYHPSAVSHLINAIDRQTVGVVAQNYPFYIKLGQAGTEKLLLEVLRSRFSEQMCKDYLNCGNEQIEEVATDIAHANGYFVLPDFGQHVEPK